MQTELDGCQSCEELREQIEAMQAKIQTLYDALEEAAGELDSLEDQCGDARKAAAKVLHDIDP